MNPISIIKFGIGALSSIGVGIIVDNAVKIVTPVQVGLVRKGLIWIGGTALAGFAGEYVGRHAEDTFQTSINFVRTFSDTVKERLKEYDLKKAEQIDQNEKTAMET